MQENNIDTKFSSLKIRLTNLLELKLNDVGSLTINDQYVYYHADHPQKECYQYGIVPLSMISFILYDET